MRLFNYISVCADHHFGEADRFFNAISLFDIVIEELINWHIIPLYLRHFNYLTFRLSRCFENRAILEEHSSVFAIHLVHHWAA